MTATVLSWVLACTSLTVMWLAGNKRVEAWWVGLISQALWVWYALLTQTYGWILMALILSLVYARNIWKWRK